jgi:uncharacterized protein (TIGR04255 family)
MIVMEDPLVGPPPAEVPLKEAPLVRVIAQVRFPLILAIEQRDFVAPFQEALRAAYPVLREEPGQELHFGEAGLAVQVKPQLVWRFSDLEGHWRVSLSPEFLALETIHYTSRADFFERFRFVVQALIQHVRPSQVDRLGVRYIDRIVGAAVEEISQLVRAEVRGILGTAAAEHVVHSISQSVFAVDGARVTARWGQLPANATVDVSAIEPVAEKSWILDLDMARETPMAFEADRIAAEAKGFAERIYKIFRWAVSEEFLRRYGGGLS